MCEWRRYHSSPQHQSLSSKTVGRALICSQGTITRKEHEKELEFTISFDPSRKIVHRIEHPRLQCIFCYILHAGREDLDRVHRKPTTAERFYGHDVPLETWRSGVRRLIWDNSYKTYLLLYSNKLPARGQTFTCNCTKILFSAK